MSEHTPSALRVAVVAEVRRLIAAGVLIPAPVPAPFAASPREVEVLQGLADGLTEKSIGARLFLSPNTIKSHKHRLFTRMGLATSAEAVAAGFRAGVLR